MHQYTTITRQPYAEMPQHLALLDAAVTGEIPSSNRDAPLRRQVWARTEGVVIDEQKKVVFFVARLLHDGVPSDRRALIPIEALEIEHTWSSRTQLALSWTHEQLLAQPKFTDNASLPENPWNGGPPVTGRWMPAVPNPVPPRGGLDKRAFAYAGTWGLASAVLGAVIGIMAGSVLVAWSLALLFTLGGAIAGFLYGGSRDSAMDASEFHARRPEYIPWEIQLVERSLRHATALERSVLDVTPIRPTAPHRDSHPGSSHGGARPHVAHA